MTKTGFIAIVGCPNVGKSTLLNAILGEKIAIVSNKPQTTRNRITGILTKGESQYVFMDTPGLHIPRTKLGDYMVKTASGAIGDVDAVILVVEAGDRIRESERNIIKQLKQNGIPALLVINKIDRVNPEIVAKAIETYAPLYDFESVIPIAAVKNDGIDIVLKECERFMHESPWFFPADEVTDQPERQIAAEIIREKLLRLLEDEIPHGTAVVIEDFKESSKMVSIRAEIFCEKSSHKGIIIGKNGEMLKKIGTYAREDLESFFGTKVFLNLWVKIKENWRDNQNRLNEFGYKSE